VVKNAMTDIKPGLLQSGTAIGMGLATAVNRLKDSEAKAKVVILLTDGMDNSGAIKPGDAASIAKTFGIRVYTIGVGTKGKALQPVAIDRNGEYIFDWQDVEIDEEVLQQIADKTGGKYFRATTLEKLKAVYEEIDQLEKTKFQVSQYSRRHEEFWKFLLPGLFLMLFEISLRNTIFRTTP
jgi:Ca-activated chloride channel family protein